MTERVGGSPRSSSQGATDEPEPSVPTADALRGIKVLDLSAVLAAPVAATILGDFGAEVIKVEEPRHGDFPRRRAAHPGGRTPMWAQEGRNKDSITLDLRQPEGQDIARRLASSCDVVVTNFRPQTAVRGVCRQSSSWPSTTSSWSSPSPDTD